MKPERFSKLTLYIAFLIAMAVVIWLARQAPSERFSPDSALGPAVSAIEGLSMQATSSISYGYGDIVAPRGHIRGIFATSTEALELGLGGRDSLPKDSGMLFVFPKAGVFGFWMKGMRFPLDIVWIGADKRVVGVDPGIYPETYPGIFYPPSEIRYVLELNSHSATEFGIATGTKLVF